MDTKFSLGHAVNNLSMVLLLGWCGRRLLFPSDAEWNETVEGRVLFGKSNGSWNVMWRERRAELSQPLDFLLVGHHGSAFATPWMRPGRTGQQHPINQILDALLPRPPAGQAPIAQAVVSTLRTQRWPSIPDADSLSELGQRVANVRTMYTEGARSSPVVQDNTPQPQRTDLEHQALGLEKPVDYIEIEFRPL